MSSTTFLMSAISYQGCQILAGVVLSIITNQSQGLHPGWAEGQIDAHSGSISCPTAPSGEYLIDLFICTHFSIVYFVRFTTSHVPSLINNKLVCTTFIVFFILGYHRVIGRILQRQDKCAPRSLRHWWSHCWGD